ncbi:hypothetical protein [Fodinibius salsisoli]|nr:hypothetical protein [Fodinibius salsisoli]
MALIMIGQSFFCHSSLLRREGPGMGHRCTALRSVAEGFTTPK